MNKNSRIRIMLVGLFIIANLASCLPMSDEQIAASAQKIYTNLDELTEQTAKIDKLSVKRNLADEQDLKLSGRSISNIDSMFANQNDWLFTNQVFIGLTRQDPDSGEFKPAMAESWNISEDLQTWTFDLYEQVPWVSFNSESGQVEKVLDDTGEVRYVTSQDFKAGMLRVLNPDNFLSNTYYLNTIKGASDYVNGAGDEDAVGIEAPEDYKIIIYTDQPNSNLDALAEMPVFSAYPSWFSGNLNTSGLPAEVEHGYGYGPYVIKEYTEGSHILLVRNPYWKGTAGVGEAILDEISYDLGSEQDVLASYQAGEIDAVKLTFEEYNQAKDNPELVDDILITPGSCGYYLFFKQIDYGIASTAETRKMIAAAINKENLNRDLFFGTAEVLNQFAPDFVRGGVPAKKAVGLAYDAEKADDYFSELGLADQNVEPLQLYTMDSEMNRALLDAIAEDLENINVPTSVVISTNWQEYYQILFEENGFTNIVLAEYCMDYADAQTLWDTWLGSVLTTTSENWQAEEFFNQLDKSLTQEKVSDRVDIYAQMEKLSIQEDAVVIPLVWGSNYWLRRPSLDGSLHALYPQLEDWAFLK